MSYKEDQEGGDKSDSWEQEVCEDGPVALSCRVGRHRAPIQPAVLGVVPRCLIFHRCLIWQTPLADRSVPCCRPLGATTTLRSTLVSEDEEEEAVGGSQKSAAKKDKKAKSAEPAAKVWVGRVGLDWHCRLAGRALE